MSFSEGLFRTILEKYIDPIKDKIIDIPKDAWEKFKVDFDIVFKKYTEITYKKYSKIKTILYRTEPKYIYDFFEAPTLEKDNANIETTNINTVLNISNFIIIQGTGGIGKSTLLKHFFINELEQKDLIPVFFELKDINNLDKDYEITEIILEKLNNQGSTLEKKYMEYALQTGCFLFLLDGYDEITAEHKDSFLKKLDTFCDKYSSNYYIISSRPCSEFIEFQRFTVLDTKELSKTQAISLVRKLNFDSEIKQRFISALDDKLYEQHRSFASNPLLLNIMLMTFDNYAEIPEKLHLFYSNAFETLYSKHDATKAGYRREMLCKLSYDEFRKVFSYFCFISYNKGKIAFSRDDLYTFLKQSSETSKITFDIKNYIDDLVHSLCVLYKDGLEYKFTHRSFQEYFTAVFLKELPDDLMKKISIQMINQDLYSIFTDSVFNMLYDMSKERFEQNILLPILEECEKECTITNKYDFYFERTISAICFDILDDKMELAYITKEPKNNINFIKWYIYLSQIRTQDYNNDDLDYSEKKIFDYISNKYEYSFGNDMDIPKSDQTLYTLLKQTWIGDMIKTMSTLSDTLKKNQEQIHLDISSLMD